MDSKPYIKLAKGCLILLHGLRSVHNSRKNQLYTYKSYQTHLGDSVHNKKNQLYTYLACENRPSVLTYCDSYAT